MDRPSLRTDRSRFRGETDFIEQGDRVRSLSKPPGHPIRMSELLDRGGAAGLLDLLLDLLGLVLVHAFLDDLGGAFD